MVSHQMMLRIQEVMTTDPEPIRELSTRLGIDRSNLYRYLRAMMELGLVEKVELPKGVGWRRT